jgi:hypothetical protein
MANLAKGSFLHALARQTDRQTDRRTDRPANRPAPLPPSRVSERGAAAVRWRVVPAEPGRAPAKFSNFTTALVPPSLPLSQGFGYLGGRVWWCLSPITSHVPMHIVLYIACFSIHRD